ncbi:MAG: glycoside hydrolase family 127 protein [Oscillospiraceae bacterium]|nr:glycoside hydrolase family 127 protein [Oscillospiraceae bacterium]
MRHPFRRLTALMAAAALLGSSGILGAPLSADAASISIRDVGLTDVTMTDAYCTNAFEKEMDYLLAFDTEKLLAGFRENAGLSTNGATRYGGWENTTLGGHCIGHYLTALAQAYQHPDLTSEQRDALYSRMKKLIDEMRVCQLHPRGKQGFLWAAPVPSDGNVERQFDRVEQGKANIFDDAWVPWYTMHKLIAGIVDVYNATGYDNAKALGSDLGDWVYNRVSKWSPQTQDTVLSIEYGGMNDCLYDLYAVTGKDTHAVAAHYFDQTALHELVLKGGANVLDGRHANTTIPKFLGALKRYIVLDGKTVNGERVDASRYLQYAEAFWDMVVTHHTYITGGNSEWEHFGRDDILDAERTNCNCETCNSYNMLKLSRELFKITHDVKYMDYYETTYYNSILSSQNPETGMTTYFQPMATGFFKVYSTRWDKFWCCTGSGMESFTKLGDTIYMQSDDALYVNLYQSSKVDWEAKGVTITQETDIPWSDTATFTVDGSGALDLRFRIPDWTAGTMTAEVNGTRYSYKTVDGYAQVTGDFQSGDKVVLHIPAAVKAYALPDAPNVYGFKYGPIVLSAELGKEDMKTDSTGMWVTIPKEKKVASETITLAKEGQSLTSFMAQIGDHLVREPGTTRFILNDTSQKLTFSPHYQQYQQRYGIYWKFVPNGTVIEERLPRANTTNTDTVQHGYGQYESDNLHKMVEYRTTGVTNDSTYRYAEQDGWFTYRMAVDPDAPMLVLDVKLRKADNGRSLRVRVGDAVLYAGTLAYEGSDDVYDLKLTIPQDVRDRCTYGLTADGVDHQVLDVTFSSNDPDEASAKVCDFLYMQAVTPLYQYDTQAAYFVDCGDHDADTLSGRDKLGLYNSVTEQLYGPDEVTGRMWGLIDDPTDQYKGAGKSHALYTANTWPDEYHTADGLDKTATWRYTKNQYENGIDRHLDYAFELPNGTYSVELAFADPWGCSKSPTAYANIGKASESVIVKDAPTDGSAVRGEVKVTDGALTVNVRSADKAINLCYILIKPVDVEAPSTIGRKGDINIDGRVDVLDAVLLQKHLHGMAPFNGEQAYAADMMRDAAADAFDLAMLKRTLLS